MFFSKFCRKTISTMLITFMFFLNFNAFSIGKTNKIERTIEDGSLKEIKQLFKKYDHLQNSKFGKDKDTLFLYAIKNNRDPEILDFIVKAGVNINKTNKQKQNAFVYSCLYSENDTNTLNYLLKKWQNPGKISKAILKKDKNGKSAYDYAKENQNPEILKILYKYIPDEIKELEKNNNKQSEPPEDQPEISNNDENAAEISKDETENSANNNEPTPEEDNNIKGEAFKQQEKEKLEKINEREERLISISREAETPVKPSQTFLFDYEPIEKDETPDETSEEIQLATIVHPNSRDENGRTPLMKAVKSGNDWEVKSLLKSGADVNLADNEGWTAIMYAARYQNNLQILELLLQEGADLSATNKYGNNALQLSACYSNNPEILKKIIQEYQSGSNEVFKSFILAITTDSSNHVTQKAKLEVFISKGISINRFYEGKTPLMYACEYCSSTQIIGLLLKNGAIASMRDSTGKKAFDYAVLNNKLEHDDYFWKLNSN